MNSFSTTDQCKSRDRCLFSQASRAFNLSVTDALVQQMMSLKEAKATFVLFLEMLSRCKRFCLFSLRDTEDYWPPGFFFQLLIKTNRRMGEVTLTVTLSQSTSSSVTWMLLHCFDKELPQRVTSCYCCEMD